MVPDDPGGALARIVLGTPWLVSVLETVRDVVPDAHVGAGAIRNAVWDTLHEVPPREPCDGSDIDVVYFAPAQADEYATKLRERHPEYVWEVTNQATVHDWFGWATIPFTSLEEGIASWPETATAVAVRLADWSRGIEIVAPYGLDDLFSLRVRQSPACTDPDAYRRRAREKRWLERWPRLTIAP